MSYATLAHLRDPSLNVGLGLFNRVRKLAEVALTQRLGNRVWNEGRLPGSWKLAEVALTQRLGNRVWNEGRLPGSWKLAVVALTQRLGKYPAQPKSCRPIALSSHVRLSSGTK